MALSRATRRWRTLLNQVEHNRSFASSTTPKFASTAHNAHTSSSPKKRHALLADMTVFSMIAGFVSVAVLMAVHTAKNQLVHSPSVCLTKKRRGSVPEADNPDKATAHGDKFINKSFLRKVAHIQDDKRTIPDPSRPDPFTRPRNSESLKSAGMNKGSH